MQLLCLSSLCCSAVLGSCITDRAGAHGSRTGGCACSATHHAASGGMLHHVRLAKEHKGQAGVARCERAGPTKATESISKDAALVPKVMHCPECSNHTKKVAKTGVGSSIVKVTSKHIPVGLQHTCLPQQVPTSSTHCAPHTPAKLCCCWPPPLFGGP